MTSGLAPALRPVISHVEAYRVAVTSPWRDDEPAVSHRIERRTPKWGGLPVVYATNDSPLEKPATGLPEYGTYSPVWGMISNDPRRSDLLAVNAPHTRRSVPVPRDCTEPLVGDTPHVGTRHVGACMYPFTKCPRN